jgi:hypothetical protein
VHITSPRRGDGGASPCGHEFPGLFTAGVASVALAMSLARLRLASSPRPPLRPFATLTAPILSILAVGYLPICITPPDFGSPNGTPAVTSAFVCTDSVRQLR